MSPDTITIGCGSAYAGDRLPPAFDLANSGLVDVLGFDALAERTLALAQLRRQANEADGYDPRLPGLVAGLVPALKGGLKVVGNFGAANVERGGAVVLQELARAGLRDVRVGVISGDDVLYLVRDLDPEIPDLGVTAGQLGDDLLSANAYLGAAPIVECLEAGAQFVLGGRIADAALFAAPVMHHFGWDSKDWDRVAHATLVGHVLECGTQSTGGYFADPPWREVPDLANLGNPYIEVGRDSAVVTKLPGTGGFVDRRTVGLQVAYEVQDPRAYLTPDVTADFADVVCEEVGTDRVRLSGAHGRAAPETAKVMVAVDRGYRAVAEIGYAAAGCLERAQLAIEVLQNSLDHLVSDLEEVRFDIVGVNALVGAGYATSGYPAEVRVRAAARTRSRSVAEEFTYAVERLYVHGPAGGGGATRTVVPALSVYPTYVPAELVVPSIEVVTA